MAWGWGAAVACALFISFCWSGVALSVSRLPCNVLELLLNFYKAIRIYEVFYGQF